MGVLIQYGCYYGLFISWPMFLSGLNNSRTKDLIQVESFFYNECNILQIHGGFFSYFRFRLLLWRSLVVHWSRK